MVEQAPVPEGPTEIPAEEAADPVAAGETGQELALVAPEPRIEMDAHAAPVVTPPGPRPRLPPDEPPAMRPGSGTIALIIDDVGPAPAWSRRALALPGPLTMAFLPYADDLDALTAQARSRGHDIFLHMPMQPIGREDPGPNALLDGMDAATLRQRLTWAIGRVSGAIGMNNHMGSRLTAEPEAMATVMDVLREHDLAFVDSRTSPRSVADGAAEKAGIAHVGRDVFLDHFPGSAFVRRQLAEVERQARTNGSVVAIGHPLPATLEVLESWIPAAKARGFRFVGVSRIIADRTCTKAPRPGCPSELTRVAAKATAP
ncbi:MAG: divergent polysaccharide deacetylase family protein [Geminicoccaceae bacterium]